MHAHNEGLAREVAPLVGVTPIKRLHNHRHQLGISHTHQAVPHRNEALKRLTHRDHTDADRDLCQPPPPRLLDPQAVLERGHECVRDRALDPHRLQHDLDERRANLHADLVLPVVCEHVALDHLVDLLHVALFDELLDHLHRHLVETLLLDPLHVELRLHSSAHRERSACKRRPVGMHEYTRRDFVKHYNSQLLSLERNKHRPVDRVPTLERGLGLLDQVRQQLAPLPRRVRWHKLVALWKRPRHVRLLDEDGGGDVAEPRGHGALRDGQVRPRAAFP
mmetsp:Transcript_19110/g.46916  ORF Transcript_19110/g.46916 Transcript_19110/m.46916 type:complete len:278 (-) Transcript_19110:774-1607(-)